MRHIVKKAAAFGLTVATALGIPATAEAGRRAPSNMGTGSAAAGQLQVRDDIARIVVRYFDQPPGMVYLPYARSRGY